MLSILGVLRRPGTSSDTLPARTLRGFPLKDIYVRHIRRARNGYGLTYYVVPAGNGNLGQPIPARCSREQAAARHRELPHIPRSLRAGTLALEPRFVNQTRHDALPYPGICLVALGDGGGSGCSYSISDIEQGRAIESGGGPAEVAVTWGLVPDGVATVTIVYPAPGGHGHAPTATGKVINNIFIIPNRGRWLTNSEMVWRSATGAVIKTFSP